MKVLGIDLAGKETNPTGIALLSDAGLKTKLVRTDDEILEECRNSSPNLVAIDAPLGFPKKGGLRRADLELISRGHRVFPPIFGGMKFLTQRGARIARKLRAEGFRVIEVHPRTSGKIIFGTHERKKWVSELSGRGMDLKSGVSPHEVDSVLAALTAQFHMQGKSEEVGDPSEGTIIIPRP